MHSHGLCGTDGLLLPQTCVFAKDSGRDGAQIQSANGGLGKRKVFGVVEMPRSPSSLSPVREYTRNASGAYTGLSLSVATSVQKQAWDSGLGPEGPR